MEKVVAVSKTKSKSSNINYGAMLGKISPYVGLVIGTIVFQILTGGKLLTISNIQSLTNQIIITALVAIGAVYVFGIGAFDMSLGSLVCLGSVLGGDSCYLHRKSLVGIYRLHDSTLSSRNYKRYLCFLC